MAMDSNNSNGKSDGVDDVVESFVLPEGCIASALSLTSPLDVCRLSLVSPTFRSAAESDAVWERFLPSDCQDIIAQSVTPQLAFPSKKKLYLDLCDHPLIIDDGKKSFSLEKWSGKTCYMLAASHLSIVWGATPIYWTWISLRESRFREVAELLGVTWLEIRSKINTSMLSPDITYAAFLVFKLTSEAYGFEYPPAKASVGLSGGESQTRTVYLAGHVFGDNDQYPQQRNDGWLEIELGVYVNEGGEDDELEMSLMEVTQGNWKCGLIVQGIEIRPKWNVYTHFQFLKRVN